ncbi:glycosyltransferase family 39 protein [Chloroflexi bacterium TSY]|nr:glycosyltransferase family 39 protein [Chloroflexi bacterium TSY]
MQSSNNASAHRLLHLTAFWLFPLLVALFATILYVSPRLYLLLLDEDQLIEWLSFTMLEVAALLALTVAVSVKPERRAGLKEYSQIGKILRWLQTFPWFFVGIALFATFGALEEISWGQRIFQLTPPAFFQENNSQAEINLHNLTALQFQLKVRELLALFCIGYGILLPFLTLLKPLRIWLERLGVIIPPLILIPGFGLTALLMFDIPTGFEEELGEFLFTLCLLFLVAIKGGRWLYGFPEKSDSTTLKTETEQNFTESALDIGEILPEIRLQEKTLPKWMRIDKERSWLLGFTVLGFALRVLRLDGFGLDFAEAQIALTAQAEALEIMQRHWSQFAQFPPAWTLMMRSWTSIAGQTETALRFLSALTGTLMVPTIWLLVRRFSGQDRLPPLLAAAFYAASPTLILYSQQAALYLPITLFGMFSILMTLRLAAEQTRQNLVLWIVVNWVMLLLHFHTVLLIGVEFLFLFYRRLVDQRHSAYSWPSLVIALLVSSFPAIVWMGGLPGIVPLYDSFAAYSAEVAQQLSQRFLFFQVPVLAVVVSWLLAGIIRERAKIGMTLFMIFATLILADLVYYFGIYQPIQYREMAAYLTPRLEPEQGIVIEAPQQHLLAKYYLSGSCGDLMGFPVFLAEQEKTCSRTTSNLSVQPQWLPIPHVSLPRHWPVDVPDLVPEEMDDWVQQHLREYSTLWLIMSGEKLVDESRFLRRYLNAVAHKEWCREWVSVELCRFQSSKVRAPARERPLNIFYNQEVWLGETQLFETEMQPTGELALLVNLSWRVEHKPTREYKLSLRLLDSQQTILHQQDDFPVGTLIPSQVWNPGDQHLTHMALVIPADSPAQTYSITVELYDAVNLKPLPFTAEALDDSSGPIEIAQFALSGNDYQLTWLNSP